jgi:hypothetical protein
LEVVPEKVIGEVEVEFLGLEAEITGAIAISTSQSYSWSR